MEKKYLHVIGLVGCFSNGNIIVSFSVGPDPK